MRRATEVKSAKARSTIAAQLILAGRTSERAFDDCFEMNDGSIVAGLLVEKAKKNERLRVAMEVAGLQFNVPEEQQQTLF